MVRDIILTQKLELEHRLKESYIKRESRLMCLESDMIKVIIGPRRAGKSFFAINALSGEGSFGYVNFDDERLIGEKDYDSIIDAVDSVYESPKYLLFDEIQNLDGWELFVNRLQRRGYNLVLTGSNSKLLSRELATHLTGRHLQTAIFPFSFREYLKLETKELTENQTKEKLEEYLAYGGYPEPYVKKLDYKDYLSTLFTSIIYKDIVKRHRMRSYSAIEDLAAYLLANTAKEFSIATLSKETKTKSPRTVEKYLGFLEESYLFFRIDRFSYKVREQMASNKKIYCIDNGYIYAKAFRISPDKGKLYENLVAIELKKRETDGGIKLYYWKNAQQEEVDFLVRQGTKTEELIQVCYDTGDIKTKEREIRALINASKEQKCDKLTVITKDCESMQDEEWFGTKKRIRYIPMWKWLLEN
jgi:predicted AAA+ superfamily ATPase